MQAANKLKLWTIRKPIEISKLEKNSLLIADDQLIEPEYLDAYNWMATKLESQSKRPSYCRYPIWAWKCWDIERSCRPDLRVRWGERHEKLCLVELEIPSKYVLLSEYHLWHHALNLEYLPINEEDQSNFENYIQLTGKTHAIYPLPEPYQSQLHESWNHMFSWKHLDKGYHGKSLGSSIQGVFWELRQRWVKNIIYFKSK